MKTIEKNLDIGIKLRSDGLITVNVYEPETGDTKSIETFFSPDEHPVFNDELGEEIYSWILLWLDELEDMEEGGI